MQLKLGGLEDAAARRLAGLLADMERELVGALQNGLRGEYNLNAANALFNEISRISENGLFQQQAWMDAEIPQLLRGALKVDETLLGIVGFSAENIRDTFAAYERTSAYQQLMSTGYQRWWNEFAMRNERFLSTLQGEMVRGAALGMDSKAMAEKLIESSKTLNLDVGKPEVWAHKVIRTESTRLSNDMRMGFASEIGIEKFWWFVIDDGRCTSGICPEAGQQDPMTMQEWAGSQYGLPPLHPNCRCQLMPWHEDWELRPEDLVGEQMNIYAEEVAA